MSYQSPNPDKPIPPGSHLSKTDADHHPSATRARDLPDNLQSLLVKAKVLVVDDTPDNLAVVATLLLDAGSEVFVANSGESALQVVETLVPDLVLLDLAMPGIGGIETLTRLKAMVELRLVPVIVVTAHAGEQALLDSFAAGAVDYLAKPFNPVVLLARASTHIQHYRRSRELEQLADIDSLTGLPNRRLFDRRVHEEWQRGRRNANLLALLVVDVDWFKQYNDGYGHQQGDQVLRRVAAALQQCCRRVGDFCCRYGGEEFVVLTACEDEDDAATLADRILGKVQALAIVHEFSGSEHILTVSIGYACAQVGAGTFPASLFEAADTALYRAKDNGRNRIELGRIARPSTSSDIGTPF